MCNFELCASPCGVQRDQHVVKLIFEAAADKLIAALSLVEGEAVQAAHAACGYQIQGVADTLEGVCPQAAMDIRKYMRYITSEARLRPRDLAATEAFSFKMWGIIAGLKGDRREFAEMYKDAETRRKK